MSNTAPDAEGMVLDTDPNIDIALDGLAVDEDDEAIAPEDETGEEADR